MRPAPPWWWYRRRVIKVESHLVGKLTSIRTILPRGLSPPLCFPPSIPPTQYIPDSHPPSFILPDPLPHHVSAPHLPSSLSHFLLSFLIFPYPLSVITLYLSSSPLLFCDGNLRFWGTLKFATIGCVQEISYLPKSLVLRKCLLFSVHSTWLSYISLKCNVFISICSVGVND